MTYKNKNKINIWTNFYWKFPDEPMWDFEENALNPSLEDFNNKIITPLLYNKVINENDLINIQFKVSSSNVFRSVSLMQRINIKNLDNLNDIFIGYWNSREGEFYTPNQLDHIIFFYKIITKSASVPENFKEKITKFENSKLNRIKPYTHNISDINVPMTMDLYEWGKVVHDSENNLAIIHKSSSNLRYFVDIEEYSYNVKILTIEDNILFKFRDTILSRNDLYHFKREVFNNTGDFKKKDDITKIFIYKDNEIIFKSYFKKYNKITKLNKDISANPRIITMDIETKTINSKMVPIAISSYDGKNIKSFFILDYKNYDDMIKASLIYLIKGKYNFYKVYFHNFSNFDSVFILKNLKLLTSKLDPIIRDGLIIELKCQFGSGKNPLRLFFRDSYLLLPASLDKLGKNFECGEKMLFPYKFINQEDIDFNYSGLVPDISYFETKNEDEDYNLDNEYNKYCEKFIGKEWNLRRETIKYCESDVVLLHKVISKFQKKIYYYYHIDILKSPTLPALAFAIFRSNYLDELNLPKLDGHVYDFISQGYTGGAVDLYYHRNESDEKVYRYDVNSLYPYIMSTTELPVGDPIEFEGNILDLDIRKQLKDNYPDYFQDTPPYGFFEVDVESPKDLFIPILQKRIKILNKGFRTIAPLGKWTGVYHSNEIYNAMKAGYKFKIKKGFLFQKKIIFKDYVEFLYEMKKNSSKDSPDYVISKLLMNSLYGRFGMSPYLESHAIVSISEFDELVSSSKIDIKDSLNIGDGNLLISFFEDKIEEELLGFNKNINVAIAAAVTAEARIYMSKFKSLKDYKIFYSDTDSIDLNKPLPEELVGKNLGQMKLEHVWKNVIYISNKAYIGISDKKDKKGKFKLYSKIKGIKDYNLSFEELNTLLLKDNSLNIPQERWHKDRENSTIIVKEINLKLKSNNNKRISVFDENNTMIYTKPLVINKDEIINTPPGVSGGT